MKKLVIILTMLALLLIIGCNAKDGRRIGNEYLPSSNYAKTSGFAYDDGVMATRTENTSFYGIAEEELFLNDTSSESSLLNEKERKLTKRANLRIRVESLESVDSSVTEMMNKYDGYAAMTEFEENSRFYSLRIPSNRYDAFLSEMEGVGRLLRRSENVEDVTVRYYDLEGRLESKKELLKTFQSYLGRAKNMEEILAVESKIAELQYDIDFTGTQLRELTSKIDYATIDLYLLGPVTQTVYRGETFGEKIKQLFGNLGSFFSSVVVFILGFIIYGIPIIGIIILLIWLLFGKIGLLKKLWRLVVAKKQ